MQNTKPIIEVTLVKKTKEGKGARMSVGPKTQRISGFSNSVQWSIFDV